MALPTGSRRKGTIKAKATQRWKGSSQSESGPVQSKGPGKCFWACSGHFACGLLEASKVDNSYLLGECFEKVSTLVGKRSRKHHWRVIFHHNNGPAHGSHKQGQFCESLCKKSLGFHLTILIGFLVTSFSFHNLKVFKGHPFSSVNIVKKKNTVT